jgi:hypothetical protein
MAYRGTMGRRLVALLAVVALAGCVGASPSDSIQPTARATGPTPSATESASPLTPSSTSPSASAPTLPSGPPAPGCARGWRTLAADDPLTVEALHLIADQMGITGPFTVDEIRYFEGPDSPGVIEPRFDPVRRWYVKAALRADPTFRGRWLVESREPGREGISAVAPYASVGYTSPDWRGFEGDGAPRVIAGLPGEWAGVDYDFVTGEGDNGQRGLPPEVEGCLAGT